MERTVRILLSDEEADPDRVAELTGYLRQELLQLDVDRVTAVPGEPAPPGARAVDAAQLGALLVTLGTSVTALNQVVTVLRDWFGRVRRTRPDSRPALRLVMDDDVLEISDASDEQVTEALRVFVQRHAAPTEARP
ncbi:hypothetical protein ACFYZU_17220 [Streptomyces sp. NPDC001651]|uniref:hypothetical protein n=1 Tax=unclassified Streptomyces TaxID=2593676 RepID=UPI00368D6578